MATALLRSLPKPKNDEEPFVEPAAPIAERSMARPGGFQAPPYGSRKGFIPRKPEHFGDGGAYPEVHVAQYPLDMGKKDTTKSSSVLPVSMDEEGNINYDAIVKQDSNSRAGKIVHTAHSALVPKPELAGQALAKPDDDEIEETRKRTEAALNKVVGIKIQAAQPKTLAPEPGAPTYIKYTPSQRGEAFNSGASQRIIKMYEKPVDPLEPPKFKHKKVPRGPGSPPVPIMHSPPRALTAADQADWKIPPCISNWKNAKGYTIPLDKRLAADGRGLQEVQINDNFAKLSEALYVAESKAREAVEMRGRIQKELMVKDKERKEDELRRLAQKARMEHMGGGGMAARAEPAGGVPPGPPGPPPGPPAGSPPRGSGGGGGGGGRGGYSDDESPPPVRREEGHRESREEREERKRRDEIREERRRERERERRMEEANIRGGKKSKITRDRDRDISEKVALGQANVGAGGGETMYDQRLFNQEEGMASGFGAEDSYNVYDKGLFVDRGSALYRPSKDAAAGDEEERERSFKPDKGFAGTEGGGGAPRNAPVEFEKKEEEADPFGLDQFLTEVKKGKNAMDKLGGRGGSMAAGGGAAGGSYDDYAAGSSRSKVAFQRESRR